MSVPMPLPMPLPMPMPMMPEPGRLDSIDALRGWAILGVVTCHTAIWCPPPGDLLHRLALSGAAGVQLFYIVSAFTLLLSYHSRPGGETRSWWFFYLRRFFRIAPLFYLAILVYGPLRELAPQYWLPEGIVWWHWASAFGFLHAWHPHAVNALVPGGWSLSVEMTFYLLFPLYLLVATTLRRALLLFVALTLVGVLYQQWAIGFFAEAFAERHLHYLHHYAEVFAPPVQLPVFALGFIVFMLTGMRWQATPLIMKDIPVNFTLSQSRWISPSRVRWVSLSLIVAAGTGYVLAVFMDPQWVPGHVTLAVCLAALVYAITLYPWRLIVNPVMIFIGRISYSLYVVHFGVIWLWRWISPAGHFTGDGHVDALIAWVLVLVPSVMAAYVSFVAIEQPGIRLGGKVIMYLRNLRATTR